MADIFGCNFGKYGVVGQNVCAPLAGNVTSNSIAMAGEWTSVSTATGGYIMTFTPAFSAARFGVGISMSMVSAGAGTIGNGFISKTLPASISRIIGGIAVTPSLITGTQFGVLFCDGIGTPQIGIGFNGSGQIVVYSGGNSSGAPTTVIATSSASVSAGTSHWLEWDITINNSTGAYTIDLDGTTVLTASNVDTRGGSSNNSINVFQLWAGVTTGANGMYGIFGESLYLFDSTGAVNNAIFGVAEVELDLMTADSSAGFSIGQGVLGYFWPGNTATTNAPGANELFLVPFTPAVSGVLVSMGCSPAASNPSANFKPVLYGSNASGIPDGTALLASGAQVSGAASGAYLTAPFSIGYAYAAGTKYWGGFITDTSVALNQSYATSDPLVGRKAANTYSSGVPATAPSMTGGQATWQIWGNTSGQAHNYSEVNDVPPPGALSYVMGAASGLLDQYIHAALSSAAASIGFVKVSAYCWDSDAGPRTTNFCVTSNGTSGYGSVSGFTPPTTSGWSSSYFDTDPHTAAAWTTSGYNAAVLGPQIVA